MRFLIILAALVATLLGANWFTGLSADDDCVAAGGTYTNGTCEY